MIIISIGGGLGNQMFEYAFGYAMQKKYSGIDIRYDVFHCFPYCHNGMELTKDFGLPVKEAELSDIKRLADVYPPEGLHFFAYRVKRKLGIHSKSFREQRNYTKYYPDLMKIDTTKDYYFYGVFANYRYFRDYEDEIQNLFSFVELDDKNREIAGKIKSTNSVSIHVRRGDYVDLDANLITADYYKKAIRILRDKLGSSLELFIFSDDAEAARDMFKDVNNTNFIDWNTGSDSFRDMQLMSLCKHNIIANSTFSFWGAYLNRNPQKIVISPNKAMSQNLLPFTCDEWIKI